jgi:rubrerythrin
MTRLVGESRPRRRDVTGVAYGMWRCGSCGEMGRLGRSLPRSCPGCGEPREALFYWAED